MTNEVSDEDFFGEMKLLFASKGWEYLCEELLDNVAQLEDLQTIGTFEELQFRKGQLATIGVLLNYPEAINRAEQQDTQNEGT